MGYNKRPGVVTQYAETLEQIKTAIDSHREATFPVRSGESLTRIRDKLHWMLSCAQTFQDEKEGRYSDLRERATVSTDWNRSVVVIRPKGSGQNSQLKTQPPSEHDVLRELSLVKTDAHILNFKPSPGFLLPLFESRIEERGWTVRVLHHDPGDPEFGIPERIVGELNTIDAKIEGWLGLIAVRVDPPKPSSGPLDILKGPGFTPIPDQH